MGDRGNIFVVDSWASKGKPESVGVYLYTHWGGYGLPEVLAKALDSPAGRSRWSDGPYLTRIIFDHMTGLEGGATGFGISSSIGDNEYSILVVIPESQLVGMVNEGEEVSIDPTKGRWWTFEEFIEECPSW